MGDTRVCVRLLFYSARSATVPNVQNVIIDSRPSFSFSLKRGRIWQKKEIVLPAAAYSVVQLQFPKMNMIPLVINTM